MTARSACPISSSLDVIGDKWSLLIVRDLLAGPRRYGNFLKEPERITTSVLADRLASLEDAGIIAKRAYQERPLRYEYLLTRKGVALLPLLQEMAGWGLRYIEGTQALPAPFMWMRLREAS